MTSITSTTGTKEKVEDTKKEQTSNLSELAQAVLVALTPIYDEFRKETGEMARGEEEKNRVELLNEMFYLWKKLGEEVNSDEKNRIAEKLAGSSVTASMALAEIRAKSTEQAEGTEEDKRKSNIIANFMARLRGLAKSAGDDAREVTG